VPLTRPPVSLRDRDNKSRPYQPGTVVNVVAELYRAHAEMGRRTRLDRINQRRFGQLRDEYVEVPLPMDFDGDL